MRSTLYCLITSYLAKEVFLVELGRSELHGDGELGVLYLLCQNTDLPSGGPCQMNIHTHTRTKDKQLALVQTRARPKTQL